MSKHEREEREAANAVLHRLATEVAAEIIDERDTDITDQIRQAIRGQLEPELDADTVSKHLESVVGDKLEDLDLDKIAEEAVKLAVEKAVKEMAESPA